ncbi:phosphotransferase family protein [Myxococcota bacterium]|nr:phosphotransferase family protein [Myxococcota bacterium]
MNTEELERGLSTLIANREPRSDHITITDLRSISGGNARSAYSFDAKWFNGKKDETRKCVLLLQLNKGQLDQELSPEFDLLDFLSKRNIPSPSSYWLDASGHYLGAPGFVMEHVSGRGELRNLLNSKYKVRNAYLAKQMAEAAARLHNVNWNTSDFKSCEIVTKENAAIKQVSIWEDLFLIHRMEPLPILVNAFGWLKRNCPVAERIVIVHGDFRFGNILYEDDKLTSILDWEMAHLGDACEDIAWAYRPLWSPHPQLAFSQFLKHYLKTRSVELNERTLLFYRLFSEVKHAVISLTGANTFAGGGNHNLRLADRMTWTTECLRQFYEWLPSNNGRGL